MACNCRTTFTFTAYTNHRYIYNRDENIEIFSGAEIPNKDGVEIRNIVTVKLNGQGQITHVINDKGDSVTSSGDTARIQSYENGEKEKY